MHNADQIHIDTTYVKCLHESLVVSPNYAQEIREFSPLRTLSADNERAAYPNACFINKYCALKKQRGSRVARLLTATS